MTIDYFQKQSSKGTSERTKSIRVGVWFAFVGGLAIPLVLWAIMARSTFILGPNFGLTVGVLFEHFLNMALPTSVVLVAPGLGLGVISGLLFLNMILWGAIGFLSELVISRASVYYGFLTFVVFGLLISNGSFVWMAFEMPALPLSLIDIPTFIIAAAAVTALFILRRRRALSQFQ